MTPKEKAQELFDKFFFATFGDSIQRKIGAKQCALIAVNEILKLYKLNWGIENYYWSEVKSELEKL